MLEIPQNITRVHLLKAIERIDSEGVPGNAHSSTYDVVHEGKAYPPKLVVSWANVFANGEELERKSFSGGKNTDCFQLLEKQGFSIVEKDDTSGLYKLWDQFLSEWPESRLKAMTLAEYTGIGNQDAFCYWVEKRLETLGSIWGGSSFKFGIYRRGDQAPKPPHPRYTYTEEFAWESKFGDSAAEAFETVKQHILTVLKSIKAKDLQTIESLPLWPVFKWKIAFLYQDRSTPLLPAVFKAEMLSDYLETDQGSHSTPFPALYHWVMKEQNDRDIVAFSRDIWTKANQIAAKKRFTPKDAEQLLMQRYLPIGEGADKIIGFLNDSNRTIALSREGKSVRVFMEPWEPSIKNVKIKQHYSVNDSRNSNLDNQAPNVANGREAILVECSKQAAFEELLDSYEIDRKQGLDSMGENVDVDKLSNNQPLNQILYGPPGTGKTFHTVNKAIQILDPGFYESHLDDRSALHARFQELKQEGRIGFVTFHQSFSYEDFVEGLKAETNDNSINYFVDDGIFKLMCIESKANIESTIKVEVADRKIWKMSLGDTLGSDNFVYDHCVEANEIRLGYGRGVDYTHCDTRAKIKEKYELEVGEISPQSYTITAVHNFKNVMKKGDLVIITDGNLKFRAIAEINSDYSFSPDDNLDNYKQTRQVLWHKVYEKSLPYDRIMRKRFSQMTIYQPSQEALNRESLQLILTPKAQSEDGSRQAARVLIIDEINRGNISSIFGELITLIEPSKRAGAEEALSVTLPYSKEPFQVPSNLYLIGTMNTADRSLALMDTALRRRFDFVEMMPDVELLGDIEVKGIDIKQMLTIMNKRIEVLYDREHTLGHAFFMPLKYEEDDEKRFALLQNIFSNKILPLLEEYFFEDWAKIRLVLGDPNKLSEHQFITENGNDYNVQTLFGMNADLGYELEEGKSYARNNKALSQPESYIGVYEI